jgi:hypothetical protein
MGAMKELWNNITNGAPYDEDVHDVLENSELMNLIEFFGNITKGSNAWDSGHTVDKLKETYGDLPTDYIYAMIKKDDKYV